MGTVGVDSEKTGHRDETEEGGTRNWEGGIIPFYKFSISLKNLDCGHPETSRYFRVLFVLRLRPFNNPKNKRKNKQTK